MSLNEREPQDTEKFNHTTLKQSATTLGIHHFLQLNILNVFGLKQSNTHQDINNTTLTSAKENRKKLR